MLARVLFQATENKLQLPFCTILTNTHTHTPFHQPHSGAIQGRGRTGSVTQGLHAQFARGQWGDCPSRPGTCPQRQEVELFHLIPQHRRALRERNFSA